jgi:elongation factor 1-gamma
MHSFRIKSNPLALLGPAATSLKEWKHVYGTKDFKSVAFPYFLNHIYNEESNTSKAPDWTLWKIEYKYNSELKALYQSKNLLSGFFDRLLENVEYIFGVGIVYGEDDSNGIMIVALIRGGDYKQVFNVAPDWDLYDYTQLSVHNEDHLKLIESVWDKGNNIANEAITGSSACLPIYSHTVLTSGLGNRMEETYEIESE